MVRRLNKEELVAGETLRVEPLTIKRLLDDGSGEEDVEVLVRGMDGYQRGLINSALALVNNNTGDVAMNAEALVTLEARVALSCLVNDDGSRMFTQSELTKKAVADFGKAWRAGTLGKIYTFAVALSGMAPGQREEIAKNSEAAQIDSSSSD